MLAPIMLLDGHQGDIFSLEFHPEGQYLASTGFDRQICKAAGLFHFNVLN